MAEGKRYDQAIRDLVDNAPTALCSWLLGSAVQAVRAPGDLHANTIDADGVFVIAGRPEPLHVEFQLRADVAGISLRLIDYWLRLRRRHGAAPTQFVVVLSPPGRFATSVGEAGLTLAVSPIHLWELPASELLDLSELFPLAALAAPATGESRLAVVEAVARRIGNDPNQERRVRLARQTATLANVYFDRPTLESIFRRLTDMTLDLRELPMIQEAMAEGRAAGHALGHAEGHAVGHAEGHARATQRATPRDAPIC